MLQAVIVFCIWAGVHQALWGTFSETSLYLPVVMVDAVVVAVIFSPFIIYQWWKENKKK